jgi:aspartate kinase
MSRLVVKFGGTSMGAPDRIARAARLVAQEVRAGQGVLVVVSAMSGETDRLVGLCNAVLDRAEARGSDEYDVALAAGEQVSSALMALALRNLGFDARSVQGWQIPIRTSPAHARARILDIDGDALGRALDAGEILVAPGFQGVTDGWRVTTLGRGGSDTSAVALAAAVKAHRCDIYTDVDGVYTTDPRIAPKAQRLERISFEEMLELASLGAKVLQTRSVELAMAYNVPVRVVSSFVEPGEANPGTLVTAEDESMEKRVVVGVAYSRDEARIALIGLPAGPERIALVFKRLAEAGVNVDMILLNAVGDAGATDLAFTIAGGDVVRARGVLEKLQEETGFSRIDAQGDLAKVSVVGVGMRSHAGVAGTLFSALAKRGVPIAATTTSEIKISVLVPGDTLELAVRALHTAYGLDAA